MATQVKKKVVPKGIRLDWTPIKEAAPVQLTPELLKGKKLSKSDACNNQQQNGALIYLIT